MWLPFDSRARARSGHFVSAAVRVMAALAKSWLAMSEAARAAESNGGRREDRTRDLRIANAALSQLS